MLSSASESGTPGSNVTSVFQNLVFTVATAGATNTVELFRARRVHPRVPRSSVRTWALVRSSMPVRSCLVPTSTRRGRSTRPTLLACRAPVNVTIVTTATAPTRVRLDPSSQSGAPGSNVTNVTGSLVFDVFGISAGTTILLFENNSQVSQLTTADATATATVSGGMVSAITIPVGDGGAGYVFTPLVTITPNPSTGPGSGATATAVLTNGVVTAINITNAGTGYTSVPTVTIAPPIATAMATTTISNSGTGGGGTGGGGTGGGGTGGGGTGGIVSGFVIANGGSGYTSVPTVTISGGGGAARRPAPP